jgi:hypothetical protein
MSENYHSPDKALPLLATDGEPYDMLTVSLMQRAADELNLTLENPRYVIVLPPDNEYSADGTKLPKGSYRVRVAGEWIADQDIDPLWERVKELLDDQPRT